MKPVFITMISLFFAVAALAQKTQKGNDLVILKNGDQLYGEIIKYQQDEQLTLRLNDGTELTILLEETKQVVQGLPGTTTQQGNIERARYAAKDFPKPKTEGLYNITQLSFALGNGSEPGMALGAGISSLVGYQFKPFFGIGLGLGLDNYARRGETIYPVFVDVRSYFPGKKKPYAYFLSLEGGYGFAFARENINITDAEGGYMMHVALGYRAITKEGVDVIFDVGAKFQKASFSRDLFNGDTEIRDLTYQRFALRIGIGLWSKK